MFFKQKTAYELRITDWSSDVCSSDLQRDEPAGARPLCMARSRDRTVSGCSDPGERAHRRDLDPAWGRGSARDRARHSAYGGQRTTARRQATAPCWRRDSSAAREPIATRSDERSGEKARVSTGQDKGSLGDEK